MNHIKKITPEHLFFFFICTYLLIGLLIVPDYGKSTDEGYEFRTADLALEIYTSPFTENAAEKYQALKQDQYYGTASTAAVLAVQRFAYPNSNQDTNQAAHYVYFLFFSTGVIGIFCLGKIFFDGWISFFAALLFATQPLLFGHAFINPKDIPVLSTFLLTVVLGIYLVDHWAQTDKRANSGSQLPRDIAPNKQRNQSWFFALLLLPVLIFFSSGIISRAVIQLVDYGYSTQDSSLIGKIFAAQTTSGSLEGYRMLAGGYTLQFYRLLSFTAPILLVLLFLLAQRKQLFNQSNGFFLLAAGAIWGFAVSTRVLAVTAGGMVGIYGLVKLKRKAVIPLTIYTLTAAVFSFITWPYAWIFGVKGYLDSLGTFNNFPWTGLIMFEGQGYLPKDLPAYYLPKLITLQFTEPFLPLVLLGIIGSLYLLVKKQVDRPVLLILYAWFFTPLFYTIIGSPTIYNNFRHLLFITPPLFIFAGFSIQLLASLIKPKTALLGICGLLLVPGVLSIAQLHPYQYVYYNAYIGGVQGASPDYEMDYWSTAFIDAMEYINENAAPGSGILVWKDNLSAEVYAAARFRFSAHTEIPEADYSDFDYAIIPTNRIAPDSIFASYPIVYSVDVDHVSLMVVLKIPSNQN